MKKTSLIILVGGGSKLTPIWEYTKKPNAKGHISLIVSHKAESWGVDEFAKEHDVPAFYKRFDLKAEKKGQVSREEYADALGKFVSQGKYWNESGLVVMAGWDLIMPKVFLDYFESSKKQGSRHRRGSYFGGRVINLHPALLPDNPDDSYVEVEGQKIPVLRGVHGNYAFELALAQGHKFSGATVHFVTPTIDVGKVILRGVVPILEGDTVETLAERVHKKEDEILPQAIDLVIANTGIA